MGDGLNPSPALPSYRQCFENQFPAYLARGMSYTEYWEMDPSLVIAYREADYLRQQRLNEQAWLQGYYIYEALCAVSPVLHAFAKNGTRPHPYLKKPVELERPKPQNAPPTPAEKQRMENGKNVMRAFMAGINKKFNKKGVGENVECGRPGASNPG